MRHILVILGASSLLASCAPVQIEHKVEPVRVEPIYINMDITLRVDERLDRFFAYEEELPAATGPAAPGPLPAPAEQGVTP